MISATPALAYSPPHQTAVRHTPIDHILVETDAPVEYQGKVSQPSDLLKTLGEFARLKNKSLKEMAEVTTENIRDFFGI